MSGGDGVNDLTPHSHPNPKNPSLGLSWLINSSQANYFQIIGQSIVLIWVIDGARPQKVRTRRPYIAYTYALDLAPRSPQDPLN